MITRKKHYEIDPNTGCWNWLLKVSHNGYGCATYQKRDYRAHVLYYTLNRGQIPTGRQLDHKCRNRKCVNPDHLEAVTAPENVHRSRVCILTEEQVAKIYSSDLKQKDLAATYGVSAATICDIKTGRTWASVTKHRKE